MKKNEIKELHTKTRDELVHHVKELKEEIVKQEREWINGKLKNTNLVRTLRKDVARAKTILHTKGFESVVEKAVKEVKTKTVEVEKKAKNVVKETK